MVGRTGDASPVSPAVATPLLVVFSRYYHLLLKLNGSREHDVT